MFTAVLFIIAPKRNNPSIYHHGINKLWFIHIKEYSLRIKENEIKENKRECSNMNGSQDTYAERTKPEQEGSMYMPYKYFHLYKIV